MTGEQTGEHDVTAKKINTCFLLRLLPLFSKPWGKFCACGRRISECDGSRRGCRPTNKTEK